MRHGIRVLVKGDARAAKRAAGRRGIPLRNVHRHPKFREVYADAPCTSFTAISRWHGESPRKPSARGFPPGALVFYSAAGCTGTQMRGSRGLSGGGGTALLAVGGIAVGAAVGGLIYARQTGRL